MVDTAPAFSFSSYTTLLTVCPELLRVRRRVGFRKSCPIARGGPATFLFHGLAGSGIFQPLGHTVTLGNFILSACGALRHLSLSDKAALRQIIW